ncbi:hypothetical protein GCM10028895_06830 [Pontibacter rugosus]
MQQNTRQYDKLLAAQEKRLEKLEKLPNTDEWVNYATTEVRMQVAMSKLLFGNRLSAAWDFRKAFQAYSEAAKRSPEFIPYKKNLGVLQVLIGSVPDQYKWFLNIIGLRGSVRQGMQNLKAATTQRNPFHLEAQLLYVVLLHMTTPEKEQLALNQARSIAKANKDNLLATFVTMHLLKKSKVKLALAVYNTKPVGSAYTLFPYLHHMAADLFLYRSDFENSIKENNIFLKQHQGKHYLKSANFKLYLAYALSDHAPQAAWYLQQVPQVGLAEVEEDKYAACYYEKQEQLIKPLMKARLFTDGGYFEEALEELSALQLNGATPPAVQAEYYYRKARILHGQDSLSQAILFYRQTLALCKGTDLYFAPNAALQLGYIYEALHQPQQAKAFYKQALSFKNHEYKNSIDAKAKLALSTM